MATEYANLQQVKDATTPKATFTFPLSKANHKVIIIEVLYYGKRMD
jgi:hypothetical protein